MNTRKIESYSKEVRKLILKLNTRTNAGFLGGSLSCVEILTTIYMNALKESEFNKRKDKFILSKGTGILALYSILHLAGLIPKKQIDSFGTQKSFLEPIGQTSVPHIENTSGSLGQGFSQGVGFALSSKLKKQNNKVYVLLGDGELQEGSIYEAIRFAGTHNLNDLIVFIDCNSLQNRSSVKKNDYSMRKEKNKFVHQTKIWESFGWETAEINGHNIKEISRELKKTDIKPKVIFAHTIKGKGISFAENSIEHNYKLKNTEEVKKARIELIGKDKVDIAVQKTLDKKVIKKKIRKIKLPKINPNNEMSLTECFLQYMISALKANLQLVSIGSDSELGEKFDKHIKRFSKLNKTNNIDVGISEFLAINIASGLSKSGFLPFYRTRTKFFNRGFEAWEHSVDYENSKVLFIGLNSGTTAQPYGATHQSYFDILQLNQFNTTVFQPSSAPQLISILDQILSNPDLYLPGFVRLWEPPEKICHNKNNQKIDLKKGYIVQKQFGKQKRISFITSGFTLFEVNKIIPFLEKTKINYNIIDLFNLSNPDKLSLSEEIKESKLIISLIDAIPSSLSNIVFDIIPQKAKYIALGITQYQLNGPIDNIFIENKMDSKNLIKLINKHLK